MANPTNTSLNQNGATDLKADAHRLMAEIALAMMQDGHASSITDMKRELFLVLSVYLPGSFPAQDRQ